MMKNSTKKIIWITITLAVVFIFAICFFFIVKTDKDSPLSVKDETLSRISEIRNTLNTDIQDVVGNIYYLSNNGDDNADGRSPQTAWKTLNKLRIEFSNSIQSGDCILFNKGDKFRGNIGFRDVKIDYRIPFIQSPQFSPPSKSPPAPRT